MTFRERRAIAEKVLNLSYRISEHSVAMKPFLRFGPFRSSEISEKEGACLIRKFWDFDYRLERILLNMLMELLGFHEIPQICVDRWKQNLARYYEAERSLHERAIETGTGYPFQGLIHGRLPQIFEELGPKKRFLYIGCGAGRECICLARNGYAVVGIDTDEKAVEMSNRWAAYLGLDFQALQMDVMELELEQGSFDGILLEFYGSWPLRSQLLRVQRNLHGVLKPLGKAFIVAPRKKYSSHWHLMGSSFPPQMTAWLLAASAVDHFRSDTDAHEYRLLWGLFSISHTAESLRRELSGMFDVERCGYEEYDPRYVLAVIRKKASCRMNEEIDGAVDGFYASEANLTTLLPHFLELLSKIEDICSKLERHERCLIDYFTAPKSEERTSPLTALDANLPAFLNLLSEAVLCGEGLMSLPRQAN